MVMRGLLLPLALSLAMVAGVSVAQEKKLTPAQQARANCTTQAQGQSLKGEARRAFMKECLQKARPARAMGPQQARMKECSAKARDQKLKGDARKSFMSDCLKKS